MKNWVKVVLIGGAVLAFIAVILLTAYVTQSYKCNARWESSGMDSEYRLMANRCLVEVSPGRFIPEESYRAVE